MTRNGKGLQLKVGHQMRLRMRNSVSFINSVFHVLHVDVFDCLQGQSTFLLVSFLSPKPNSNEQRKYSEMGIEAVLEARDAKLGSGQGAQDDGLKNETSVARFDNTSSGGHQPTTLNMRNVDVAFVFLHHYDPTRASNIPPSPRRSLRSVGTEEGTGAESCARLKGEKMQPRKGLGTREMREQVLQRTFRMEMVSVLETTLIVIVFGMADLEGVS
ncbi:hypothetical protein BDQ17DRAFT_1462916 [Cyathus striatus]|nr:hypothetical protein BDQ17DRAFT_1462916 [Cyathus striatus]